MNGLETASNLVSNSAFEAIYNKGRDWQLLLIGIGVVFFSQFVLIAGGESTDGTIPNSGRFGLILGFLMVAIAAYFFDARLRHAPWSVSFPRTLRFNVEGNRKIVFGVGVFAFAFLALRLLGGSTSGDDIWIWIVGLLGCASPFAPSMVRIAAGLRTARRSITWIDVAVVGVLMSIFVGYNASDLTDWFYSVIGDEFGFYDLGKQFAEEGITAPFSQRGVDDYHPRLGMLMKSSVMKVVGLDYFGWKFSSILMLALSIPGIYLVGALIGGRVAGAVAAAVIAFSHYLGGISHIGYDHIDSILPTVWAAAFFFLSIKTKSPLLFFVTGVLTGLCIYTNVAARIVFPVIVAFGIWWYIFGSSRGNVKWFVPFVVGAILASLPILAVDGPELVGQMYGRVIGGQNEPSQLGLIDRILRNIDFNLFAFNYNEHSSHYVSGSLLDPISAVAAVVATGFAVGRLRDPASVFLVIWLVLAFAATGAISPYDWHTVITRLFSMMLPGSLLIGLFVANFVWPININIFEAAGKLKFNPKTATVAALLISAIIVWFLNFQRSEFDTPNVFHLSPEAVSVGAINSEHCNSAAADRIAFISRGEHVIRRILDSYEPGSVSSDGQGGDKGPQSLSFFNHEEATELGFADASEFGCIVFSHPWEQQPAQVLSTIQSENPQAVAVPFSDQSGKTTITILKFP